MFFFIPFIIIIVTGQPWENKLNWIPDSAPGYIQRSRHCKLGLKPRDREARKGPHRESRKLRPLYLILLIQVLIGMQDIRRDRRKGISPLGQPASQNSLLCNPPKRRRELRPRHKEKSPLRGANWPHRKSHPGANQN